jgi:hypothetical protein
MVDRQTLALSEANQLWKAAMGSDAPGFADAGSVLHAILDGTEVATYERLASPYLRRSNVAMPKARG